MLSDNDGAKLRVVVDDGVVEREDVFGFVREPLASEDPEDEEDFDKLSVGDAVAVSLLVGDVVCTAVDVLEAVAVADGDKNVVCEAFCGAENVNVSLLETA
jgi:hypothetical protein